MTWGAIQHQFGTRQALLLAVLEDRWQRLTDRIEAADVSGETLEERLACVMTALEVALRRPRAPGGLADHARPHPIAGDE